jgi:methyl-accepting chemotaxis protein
MRLIKNLPVSAKLLLIVVPAVLALGAMLFLFISRTNEIQEQMKTTLYDEVYVSTAAIINADRDFYRAVLDESKLLLDYLTSDEQKLLMSDFNDNVSQVEERVVGAIDNVKDNPVLFSQFKHAASGLTLEEVYNDFMTNFTNWRDGYSLKTRQGDLAAHQAYFDKARDGINSMAELLEAYALDESAALDREVKSVNTISAVVISAVILFILILSILIVMYLRSNIRYITQINRRIAEGELSVTIDKKRLSKDEIGQLGTATGQILVQLNNYVSYIDEITKTLNIMAEGDMRVRLVQDYAGQFKPIKEAFLRISESLGGTLSTIRASAEQVSGGASAISNGAQVLAHGAEKQASAVEELSAVIEKVSGQTVENAEKVTDAAENMNLTLAKLSESTTSMSAMLGAMNSISDASNSIRSIIKLIDDIAFQTNILALNAAVEAARAGQHGKGFAVVAAEVKNLASKSADAASRTSELIATSIGFVNKGIAIANSTAEALSAVSDRIVDINGVFSGITGSSRSQAEAMKEINSGIAQISNVVMSNSATAEESASASQELNSQAELLVQEVLRFRLSDRGAEALVQELNAANSNVIMLHS